MFCERSILQLYHKMKRTLPLIILLIVSIPVFAQDFTGQWKGEFTDKSTSFVGWGGDKCEYVLELDCNGKKVTGYSYTYFYEGGKRFYTICRLSGTINRVTRSLEVREVERTKTNVPTNIRNCFQVHRLIFNQQGNEQNLEGTWIPAPDQEGDCGYGTTSLSRRTLQKNPLLAKNKISRISKPAIKIPVKQPETVIRQKPVKSPVTNNTVKQVVPVLPLVRDNTIIDEGIKKQNYPELEKIDIQSKVSTVNNYEKRNNTLLKTIEIQNHTFRVDLYDNGEIDGDSISLFFNGKLLLQHQRLTEKAISLTLRADEKKDVNELIMYAENLGTIPPNTALMVVTDGTKRYEVFISSDLEKSGAIRFIYKPVKGQ